MKLLSRLMLSSLLSACSLAANAAVIEINATVDLSSACSSINFCGATIPIPVEIIHAGDIIKETVTFANNQRLVQFDDDGGSEHFFGWLDNAQNTGFFTISNATITLSDLTGTLLAPLMVATQTDGVAHLGPLLEGDFIATGSSISYSGYQVQYTVDALPTNPNQYGSVWFITSADRLQVIEGPTNQVPVPPSAALLGIGLIGLAAGRRKVRKAAPDTSYTG